MKKKVLICLLVLVVFLNIATVHKNTVSLMYIRLADKCADSELYDLSNFYYSFVQIISQNSVWLDYNIAKNIIRKNWEKPVTQYKINELNKAIEHLDIAYQKYPNRVNVLAEYAYAYEELQIYEKAIEYYEKSIKKSPNWEYGLYHLAKLYGLALRDYSKGLEYINRALEQEIPDDKSERYFIKAMLLNKIKHYDEAIVYYNKYLDIYPDSVAALVNISGCEINAKDYKNAEKHIRRGLQLNPYSSYLIESEIAILKEKLQFDAAEAKALDLSKSSEDRYIAYWELAEIKRYRGNTEEAEKYYQMAKNNAQEYYDKYCQQSYDSYDIDGNCTNRYDFLQNFETDKIKQLDFGKYYK